MRVLVYTIGDRQHGMGHIIRQLVLAESLKDCGVEVRFITSENNAGRSRIVAGGYSCLIEDDEYPNMCGDYDAVLVDVESINGFSLTEELIRSVRPAARRLVVFSGAGWANDTSSVIGDIDLQVCQSVLEDVSAPNALSGAQYIITRPLYTECQSDNNSGHVVATFGGADPHQLTEIAVEALRGIERHCQIVTGEARRPIAPEEDSKHQHFHAPLNLVPHLNGAALCLCSMGMTVYEACAAGVPSLMTNWSDDHERTSDYLESLGVGINLGLWHNFTADYVHDVVLYALSRPRDLAKYGKRGKELIDGRGAARVAERIVGLCL